MFINISDSKEAENKGSSGALVRYLEKENRLPMNRVQEYWFNSNGLKIEPYEVMQKIDGNIAKLGKGDAKFFLVNISPSQKEISFLKDQYGEEGAKEKLKAYAITIMDAYARNFKREGINNNKDLVWFGKLENHRYYTYSDKEVKQGIKKRGDHKEGEQMHVQVIVSRKDATNKIKLSPQNTSRGKNEEHSKKMGQFDRVAFKQSGETLFDDLFGFDRQLKETMAFANTQKNGTLEEQVQMKALELDTAAIGQPLEYLAISTDPYPAISTGTYPAINIQIANDIDDEAIHGRNRRRKKQARTNMR
jgi:hypothetical protein